MGSAASSNIVGTAVAFLLHLLLGVRAAHRNDTRIRVAEWTRGRTSATITGMAMTIETTRASTWIIPSSTAASQTLARDTLIASHVSIWVCIAFGLPADSDLKSRRGIGNMHLTGAGLAPTT